MMGSDEIAWSDFVAAIAEMIEPLARAVGDLAEYMGMSTEDIFFGGYTPTEYARRKCKREIIREMFRPFRHGIFQMHPCPCSVPNTVWKKGRWVKRG